MSDFQKCSNNPLTETKLLWKSEFWYVALKIFFHEHNSSKISNISHNEPRILPKYKTLFSILCHLAPPRCSMESTTNSSGKSRIRL